MGRLPAGPPGLTDDLRTRAREWAERSCLEQGLSVKVSDPRTLRDVAQLLRASVEGSDPPDGREPGGVEAVVPAPAGRDDDVVEDGGDDRVLSCEGQVGPTLPQSGRGRVMTSRWVSGNAAMVRSMTPRVSAERSRPSG